MNNSTAIYENRIQDKIELELKLFINEFGNEQQIFYLTNKKIFAEGYKRIVYGDHGPYLEFEHKHIKCRLFSKFGKSFKHDDLPGSECKYYYCWLFPYGDENTKVYLQIKPVNNLPNAPKRNDGKQSSFNRKEGYADYKRGMYYVDPYSLIIGEK